jgi:hypothetical protein
MITENKVPCYKWFYGKFVLVGYVENDKKEKKYETKK